MTHEISRDVALENDDLGLVVLLEFGYDIG